MSCGTLHVGSDTTSAARKSSIKHLSHYYSRLAAGFFISTNFIFNIIFKQLFEIFFNFHLTNLNIMNNCNLFDGK